MGLSGLHMFLILVVVLIAFGPSRIGPLGKSFGEAMRGFKKGLHGDEIDVTDSAKRENLNQAPPPGPYSQQNQHQGAQPHQQNQHQQTGNRSGQQDPNKKS